MVYDRDRGVREAPDGPHFGPSGSPRSRFATDATHCTQKSAPARPHAVPSADALIADDNLPSTKLLIDLISERVFWYIQRDGADKKNKKLCSDIKRCQNAEFSSAADLLDLHAKAADFDKAKYSQRMTVIDDKLVRAMGAWCSKLELVAQSKRLNGDARHDLTPPPSETSSETNNIHVEEKLSQLRDNLEASMRNQIAEGLQKLQRELTDACDSRTAAIQHYTSQESQKLAETRNSLEVSVRNQIAEESRNLQHQIKDAYESRTAAIQDHVMQESHKLQSKIIDNYESQITTLKQDLSDEKDISKSLEVELKSMASRLAVIEANIEKQAKLSSQLDSAVKQEAFIDLESRLAKFEASQMATNQSEDGNVAEGHEADTKLDSAQPKKLDLPTAQSLYLELEAELEDKMTQFLLQKGDRIVPDERILRLAQQKVEYEETHLQKSLHVMAENFGKLMNKERDMRASLGVQVKAAAQSALAASQNVQEMKAELAKIQTTSDTNRHDHAAFTTKQDARIQNLEADMTSTRTQVQSVKCELQNSVDALWLRSTNMHAWQENFSTIRLFEAIVQHLNHSFIPQHLSNLVDIRTRVGHLESRLGDGVNKKRKIAEHSPVPFPSGR